MTSWFGENGVRMLDWAVQSSYLLIIEHLVFAQETQEKCIHLVASISRRAHVLIKAKDGATSVK